MNNTTAQPKRKKKAAGFLIVGVTGVALLAGLGTAANLSKSITDGAEKHSVTSAAVSFDAAYTVASDTISADISLGAPQSSFTLEAENTGTIPTTFAFSVDQASITDVDFDNPILAATGVLVEVSTDPSQTPDAFYAPLDQFLTTAFASDLVVEPGTGVAVQLTFYPLAVADWYSTEPAAALNQAFGTQFTFNQVSYDGGSPLLAHARANGNVIPPHDESPAWRIIYFPAADLGTITY